MVYLSQLELNPRNRSVLKALADTHLMHRMLTCSLPDADKGEIGRFLYRIEVGHGSVRVLAQSEALPKWVALGEALISIQGPQEMNWQNEDKSSKFTIGQQFRFRLRANPTFRAGKDSPATDRGKRLAILDRAGQLAWLERKGVQAGFIIAPLPEGAEWFDPFGDEPEARAQVHIIPLGFCSGIRNSTEYTMTIKHYSVQFDGILQVTDPEALVRAVESGIGSAKGFGFGLLSLARIRG